MKFGDVIVYTENEVEYNATVLSSRVLDGHGGTNDEPLLDIGFFKQVLKPGADGKPVVQAVSGTGDVLSLVQIRHDVAHESHQYSKEDQKRYSAKVFAGGRWREQEISNFTGFQADSGPSNPIKSRVTAPTHPFTGRKVAVGDVPPQGGPDRYYGLAQSDPGWVGSTKTVESVPTKDGLVNRYGLDSKDPSWGGPDKGGPAQGEPNRSGPSGPGSPVPLPNPTPRTGGRAYNEPVTAPIVGDTRSSYDETNPAPGSGDTRNPDNEPATATGGYVRGSSAPVVGKDIYPDNNPATTPGVGPNDYPAQQPTPFVPGDGAPAVPLVDKKVVS